MNSNFGSFHREMIDEQVYGDLNKNHEMECNHVAFGKMLLSKGLFEFDNNGNLVETKKGKQINWDVVAAIVKTTRKIVSDPRYNSAGLRTDKN